MALTPRSFPTHFGKETGAELKDTSRDIGALRTHHLPRVHLYTSLLTFFAVRTPTSGAMNSGFNPLSMSGGIIVSVIADAAILNRSAGRKKKQTRSAYWYHNI